MTIHISITHGFITNSSSVVHHFPGEILHDPDVQAFLKAFEIENGFIGEDLWRRGGHGDTFVYTKEDKVKCQNELHNGQSRHCSAPGIAADSDEIVTIFCDETRTLVHDLCALLHKACKKRDPNYTESYGDSYN